MYCESSVELSKEIVWHCTRDLLMANREVNKRELSRLRTIWYGIVKGRWRTKINLRYLGSSGILLVIGRRDIGGDIVMG